VAGTLGGERPVSAAVAGVLVLDAFSPEARAMIGALAAERPAGGALWLVGGAVRDALLGGAPRELDLAAPSGALELGRALAARAGAAFVALDEVRGVGRVIGPVRVDIADFRAPTLEGDLAARDFTVNALAAPLAALAASGRAPVTDPTGGLADLAAGRVRLCAPGALADDPVRILRAARLAVRPGWRLDDGVMPAARAAAPALAGVAAERVRDELARLLDGPAAGRGLRLLDALGALDVLLPESRAMRATPQPLPHHFDVWEHSLRAVEAADRLVAEAARVSDWGGEVAARFREDLGDGLTRAAMLRLAALLHDVAKPETRAEVDDRVRFIGHDVAGAARVAGIGERWRLSRRAIAVLERLVRHHLRPMHLALAGPITRRARHRFFRDLGEDAPDLLLLALADAAGLRGDDPLAVWAGEGGRVLRQLMAGAAEERALAAAPPLVTGDDVMAAFALAPGREVGRLLARAREAQALGLVATREEALALLARGGPSLDTPEPAS
jgi:putative nucleotidyltransferase with HDIG domain